MKAVRIGPATALLLGAAAFVAIYAGVQVLRIGLLSRVAAADLHEIVVLRAFTSLVLIWTMFAAVAVILRLRGQRLRDVGFAQPAPLRGWFVALVVTLLYCGFTIMGPMLRHAPMLTDWSLFRVGTAVTIGISAGICEETIFRGFVMREAADAGVPAAMQVLLSSLLFGLAHVGWGGLTGQFNVWALVSSVVATIILGALLALTYLASRRSLMPAVVAHAAIDMVIEPWLLLFMVSGARFG